MTARVILPENTLAGIRTGAGEVIHAPTAGRDFLQEYVMVAPLALSLVRGAESELFAQEPLIRPVLDAGCGDGLFAHVTYRQPLDAGIDLSTAEVRRANKRGAYHHVIHGSVTAIPVPDATFNTVISNCVFEHIAPLEEAFAEIFRVLAPGGRYLFTAHSHLYDDYLFYVRLFRKLGLRRAAELYAGFIRKLFKHFNCFSPAQWTQILGKTGFTRVTTRYYLPRRTESAFDAMLALSSLAYISKNTLGRWVIGPRLPVWRVWRPVMKRLHVIDPPDGGALFIIAHKD